MASLSNSRWQNHEERSNKSTNNGVDKAKNFVDSNEGLDESVSDF